MPIVTEEEKRETSEDYGLQEYLLHAEQRILLIQGLLMV